VRLAIKLTLSFLAVGLAGIALIAWLASRGTQGEFQRFVFAQYQSRFVSQLADYYVIHGSWTGIEANLPLPEPPPPDPDRNPKPGGLFTVTDADGVVLVPGSGLEVGQAIVIGESPGGEPIQVEGQTVGWVVGRAEALPPNPAEAAFLRRIQTILAQAAIGAGALSLLLGLILSRNLTLPLRQLTDATRRMAEGNLDQKVDVTSRDEIGQLAQAFNRMSTELSRSQALRRRMTADIAHELRTPVSILIGHADAIHDGVLPVSTETVDLMLDEALRLQRLIEDLRTLSLADAGELSIHPQPSPPDVLLREAARSFATRAEAKGIDLVVEDAAGLPPASVDPDRMDQVIRGLVDNALRHTPEGGRIVLSARAADRAVRLTVEDSGPGFAEDDLPHVFERLYRADKSRHRDGGGSGLGLAIARSIVEAHGGRIWAERGPGRGAIVHIEVPRER
jgi:two-component system, OmpR family, sensor histidine kinase BaeS